MFFVFIYTRSGRDMVGGVGEWAIFEGAQNVRTM